MEGRLTEEQITKAVLVWLEKSGWKIICYDFPQSGTGVSLHPNEDVRETKNKGAVIPDIVAHKKGTILFFENKDRFVLSDFIKTNELRTGKDYSEALEKLLKSCNPKQIFYGVALPDTPLAISKTKANLDKIDFALSVNLKREVSITYQIAAIF